MNEANIINQLNEEQLSVVCAPLGHLSVIAGAGSGKTRVLVHRIAWLLENTQVSASQILAVTFTNKAAAQMRDRVEQLLKINVKPMWVGTFHGIAHRLLRLHWQQAGLLQTFQILDADDQARLIRKVQAQLGLDEQQWPIKQSQWYINNKKEQGLRPQAITVENHFDKVMLQLYKSYEQQCEKNGLIDFTELLLRSYELLLNNEDLLAYYQDRFHHILVDEFQDTNAIQYAWIKLLAGKSGFLMIVGDDDQSVYSWRGAQVENMFRFEQDFPAQVIRLEQNYRSTKTILSAANAVIAHNDQRYGKNLWTTGESGEKIPIYEAFNEIDEAKFIVSQIRLLRQDSTITLREIAILYRSNMQSRILEKELLNAGLPYYIYGGQKFFDRAEVKDALAYLRLLVNPHDDYAFERAVNMPPRGLGHVTLSKLREHALTTHLSLWEASKDLVKQRALSARACESLKLFLQLIEKFIEESTQTSLDSLTDSIIKDSGLYAYYGNDRSDKTESRLENLQELIVSTQQHLPEVVISISPLQSYLNFVVLESADQQAQSYEESVQLMTLHAAKGLEFKIVFLAGMEEGLFPHKMSMATPSRVEEERRLCYVGMTRARKKLYLSYAQVRQMNGKSMNSARSRFINEIPSELLQEVRLRQTIARPAMLANSSLFSQNTDLEYPIGGRVIHPNFGEGIVLNYEGTGPNARIQVKFHAQGIKWLATQFAKLEKV